MSPLLSLGRAGFVLFTAMALAACAPRPDRTRPDAPAPQASQGLVYATQAAREARLAEQADWRLTGRVAFAHAADGATVNLDWTQRGAAFDIRLSAPVTGRRWRLSGRPGEAVLDGLEDGPRRSDDAERLLFEATGWSLPIAQFANWVRGARGAAPATALALDAEGRPMGWTQAGWALEFRDWWPGDPPLPRRVFARREDASVRLVVAEWSVPSP